MQANRSRDTGPEMAVRHELFRRGMRYRVAYKPLKNSRRTVDIAFPRLKIAVLVDGCFWHGCPEHLRAPSTHTDFWNQKIESTVCRDKETTQMLTEAGWQVMRFWEHENYVDVADRIQQVIVNMQNVPPIQALSSPD